jgi:peptide/nickel transport system permease protein
MALAQQVQLQQDGGARDNIGRRVAGSPALRVAGRRLISAVPVLLGVTFLTFGVMNMLPGNTAQLILGINATPQQVANLDHRLGLD